MRTLISKAQPTNTFFATVNQIYRRILPASDFVRARRNQIKSLITVHDQTIYRTTRININPRIIIVIDYNKIIHDPVIDYYNPVIDYYNPVIDYYNPVIDYYNPVIDYYNPVID